MRSLSSAHLLVLAGAAAFGSGSLALLQGLYGGSGTSPFRAEVVAIGQRAMVAGAVVAAAALAANRVRYGRAWPNHVRTTVTLPSILWALTGWLALMALPSTVALSRNPFHDVAWLAWGLQDGRWLTATYLITLVSIVALAPLASRWLTTGPVAGGDAEAIPAGPRIGRTTAILVAAGALSFALYGPPWNLRYGVYEGNHDVHLSQLQAIERGALPYIGPASIQYGPGSQLLQYAYMKATKRFSMLGYRESFIAFAAVAYAIFVARCFSLLGFGYGLVAAVLALVISPFQMFEWNGQVMHAFFGWANPFRYLGTLVVVASTPWLLTKSRGWWNPPALALGIVWGIFSWISQENLATTILAMGLFLLTAWPMGACTLRQIGAVTTNGLAGLALFWTPVLAYYLAQGELGRFVEGYFLIQQMVAAGMSNTSWDADYNRVWTQAFYATPVVLLATVWLATFDWSRRRFAAPLSPDRQRLLAVTCVALVCFTGAMFRKDSSHFINVLISVPVVLAAAAAVILQGRPRAQLLALPVLAAYVWLFPGASQLSHFTREYVQQQWSRFELARREATPAWSGHSGTAYARAGGFVVTDPMFEASPPTGLFLQEMEDVRHLVGSRPAFVHSFPSVPPEFVYFFADLIPGPILFNVSTMVFHTRLERRFLDDMRARCREFGALIGTEPDVEHVRIFEACHPDARRIAREFSGKAYFLLLAAPRP